MFDHSAFVASHKRNARAREFLNMLRHSQMYEQFITQRLLWASTNATPSDAFEEKVCTSLPASPPFLAKMWTDLDLDTHNVLKYFLVIIYLYGQIY